MSLGFILSWGLRSVDVSAIYPPLAQLGFRAITAIAPNVLLFKAAFIQADLLICWLLSRRFGYQQTTLYAWNPLIIYSFAGGTHSERILLWEILRQPHNQPKNSSMPY